MDRDEEDRLSARQRRSAEIEDTQRRMALARSGLSEDQAEAILQAIRRLAESRPELMAQDASDSLPEELRPQDLRAVGPIMKEAQRLGWIATIVCEHCGHRQTRPTRYGTHHTVWKSLLFEESV